MAAFPRVLPLVLVVLAASMAGCNFKDFYNQEGRFTVELAPQGPHNTSLSEFRSLKVAVYGVSVKQLLYAETKEFTFGDSPLLVDMVEAGTEGERIPLAEGKMNIRAVESVTLKLDVIEAIDAQGKAIPVCREGSTTPTTFPCFFLPANNAFRLEEPRWSVPRGGHVTFGFPLSVHQVDLRGDVEYFLVGNPTLVTLEKD